MLRIAIPYGTLNPAQVRMLAHVARTYDRGYGHFTTRQNMQFHWIKPEQTPDILADFAKVQPHAIQNTGERIRNISEDQYRSVESSVGTESVSKCSSRWSSYRTKKIETRS